MLHKKWTENGKSFQNQSIAMLGKSSQRIDKRKTLTISREQYSKSNVGIVNSQLLKEHTKWIYKELLKMQLILI